MAAIGARLGVNPLFELETGRLGEADFLAQVGAQLSEQLGETIDMGSFGERYFAHLTPNEPMIGYMRELRERGYKLAICTNNVREWEHRWRAMLPVDEIFDVVVDSAFVGTRKPEARIYELTLEALGVDAGSALLIDDIEANCAAARASWGSTRCGFSGPSRRSPTPRRRCGPGEPAVARGRPAGRRRCSALPL